MGAAVTGNPALAEPPPPAPPLQVAQADDAEVALLPVRVALSPKAAERLFELRVRRLLAIELDGVAEVEELATGPLAGEVIRVWIDTPNRRTALIEVRRGSRSVARRKLAISDFPADIAARVVSIASAEMVRVQARLGEPADPGAGSGNDTDGHADDDGFAVEPALTGIVLPASDPVFVGGPRFALEHRSGITSQALFTQFLIGDGSDQRLRWFEVGGHLGIRWRASDLVRLRFGAAASGIALDLPSAIAIDGQPSDGQTWTARATASVAGELRLDRQTHLALAVEPGGLIRSIHVESRQGSLSSLGGFALGLNLGLVVAPE
ncbi:MAG TPA: hypothetical protein ENK57_08335 [Polyangiaceae bacterium]|nr:hypothetical protein [Polyangiaceae bacterium]